MNLNLNLEQLGILDNCKKKPVAIGLAYNKIIASGASESWTYTAPPGHRVIITDLVGYYAGAGDLSVTVKDGATDSYLTTLSISATNIPFYAVFRSITSLIANLQYPIILEPNGQVTFSVTNTSGTNATGINATALGVMCQT